MEKLIQRKTIKSRLANLSRSDREEYSKIICDKLIDLVEKTNVKIIMSYQPIQKEVDMNWFSQYIEEKDIQICYPRIVGDDLIAISSKEFDLDQYGIRQPVNGITIDKQDIELVIIPLIGFDENLNRLGRGKGYYDRFLENTRALKVAVAYEIQKQDLIITNEQDIKMDVILTQEKDYGKDIREIKKLIISSRA